MADYEKEKKKIKKKTKKLSIMGAGPSPMRMVARHMENKRRKKQRDKELAALPMKVDDFKFDHELRKTKQSVGMKDPQTKTMKFDKVKKKSAGGSMQSYIDKAKKELGDFKSTGSKSTLSKPKSKTFRDEDEGYKPKRKKVSMGKITAMKNGGKVPKSYYSDLKQKYGPKNKKSGIDGPSKTNKKANAKTNTQVDDFSRMPTKTRKPIKKSPLIAVKEGGSLKAIPADNKGLGKLPQPVRNKMGYMKKGGVVKMRGGGAATRGMNFNRGY